MALLGSLQVRLGLDAATFQTKFNSFAKGLERDVKGFQRSMSGIGNLGTLIGGAGLGAVLSSIVTDAGNFQQSMDQIRAAAGASAPEMQALTATALNMGRTTVVSANDSARAMLDLAKAGITPAQMSAGALAATIQLATTEGMDLSIAAETMAQQLGAFHLVASDSAAVVDALAGGSIASTASVSGLAKGLEQCASIADTVGYNLNDTTATLALLAQNGIKGSDAGTSLKTMLIGLNPATKEAAGAMERYGIKLTNSKGKFLQLTQVAEILKTKLGGLSESQRLAALQTIFGTDAMRAASILTREGAAGLQKYIDATYDKNAAEKLSEARSQGFLGSLQRLNNTISAMFTEQATQTGFLQFLTDAANGARNLVEKISLAPPWVFKLGFGIAAVASAAPFLAAGLSSVAGALPILVRGLGMAAGVLTGPFGIAIAAGAAAWFLFKDQIIAGGQAVINWFKGWVTSNSSLITSLGAAWKSFTSTLAPLFSAIGTAIKTIGGAVIAAFGGDSTAVFASFQQFAGAALTGIVTGTTWLLGKFTEFTTWLTANIPGWSATIGSVATSIIQWFQNLGTYLSSTFGPLFDGWFNGFKAAWGLIGSILALAGEIVYQLNARLNQWISDMVSHISQTEAFKNSVKWLGDAFTELGQGAEKWIKIIITNLADLYNKGAKFLNDLSTSIDKTRKSLNLFGDAGEKETDRAVGHSWLADLCEKGIKHFQDLVNLGVNPAATAMKNLGAVGSRADFGMSYQIATAPKAIPVGQQAESDAKKFSREWEIALKNSQQAMDQFVRTGKLNFKDLLNSILADIASAALQGAVKGLFEGIAGMATGTGGSGAGAWGSLFGSVVKGLTSYDGGGYTGGGSRTGGLDGKGGQLAMLHPRETVVDHTRVAKATSSGGGSRRPQVNLSVPISLQPGVSRAELAQILPEVQRNIIKVIPDLIQQGGRYASAFR